MYELNEEEQKIWEQMVLWEKLGKCGFCGLNISSGNINERCHCD